MAEISLSNYLTDTADLLRDSQFQFTTRAQLIRYINRGRQQVAYRSGCIRCLISGQSPFGTSAQAGFAIPGAMVPGTQPGANPGNQNVAGAPATTSNGFNAIAGVEMYPFSYATPFLQAQFRGVKAVTDVITCGVTWGGGNRPVLNWAPWEDLQALARAWSYGVTSYPVVWSTNGDGENANLWLFPVPVQGGANAEMEWDAFCVPKDIYSDNDYDAIPHPFKNAVKYYAAYLAYLGSNRSNQATIMLKEFNENLGVSRVASDRGKVPSYYDTMYGR